MQSDEELIESANKGDPQAFETLYRRYRDWVYRLAWRFTQNQDEALDVLQETFTYLLKKLPDFELRCSMTTLLYPVVKHLSLNLRRRSARQAADDEVLGEIPAPSQEEADHWRSELAGALGGLSEEQREILLMRFVDDMALNEVAEALNIPVSTVKSRLYRALNTLRHDGRTRKYFLD